jgi:hypothetical protein
MPDRSYFNAVDERPLNFVPLAQLRKHVTEEAAAEFAEDPLNTCRIYRSSGSPTLPHPRNLRVDRVPGGCILSYGSVDELKAIVPRALPSTEGSSDNPPESMKHPFEQALSRAQASDAWKINPGFLSLGGFALAIALSLVSLPVIFDAARFHSERPPAAPWYDSRLWVAPYTAIRVALADPVTRWTRNAEGSEDWLIREAVVDGKTYWTCLKRLPVAEGPPNLPKGL